MKISALTIIVTLATGVLTIAFVDHGNGPSPNDLVVAATTRPWPVENYPVLPSLSSEMRIRIYDEIRQPKVRNAFELLNTSAKRNVDWFKAIVILEKEKAVWSLQACLVHPSENVQIKALQALVFCHA